MLACTITNNIITITGIYINVEFTIGGVHCICMYIVSLIISLFCDITF